MKFQAWFALAIYMSIFVAGVVIAPAVSVGLPIAAMGSVGFIVIFIWDRFYTDKSDLEKREFNALDTRVAVLTDSVSENVTHLEKVNEELLSRLTALEDKSKSLQSTLSFMKAGRHT